MEAERKEREAQAEARRKKDGEMRLELAKLIKEEEDRLQKREEEKAKLEKHYQKRKAKLFEISFDDEYIDVAQIIGTHDAKGQCQRACSETGTKICPCMMDPLYAGPTSSTSFVEVDVLNENDSTPLSEAAVGGAMQVLVLLLRHGAFSVVNQRDTHGRTPVFRAAFMGKKEAVELLLYYGADPRIRSKENDTAIDAASDPAIKEIFSTFTEESMNAAADQVRREKEACWKPPPPLPRPAELVPKTVHSCRVALRGLADTLDDVRKAKKRQSLIIDLNGNAQTYLR